MRTRALFCAMALIVAAALAGRGATAGGFLIYEHSGLATGMAGARTAIWDDVSSLYYNPSAITELPGYHLTLGDTLIIPKTSYTPLSAEERDPANGGHGDADGTHATNAENALFYPLHLYFSARATRWLTVGIGVNNQFGLGNFWPADWDGRYTAWQVDLKTYFVQPVLAVDIARLARLSDNIGLSVAFGANYVYGQALIKQKVDFSNFSPYASDPNWKEATMKMEGDAHAAGYNFSLFAAWKPWFSVGASVRSNVPLHFKGTASFTGFDPQAQQFISNNLHLVFPEKTTGKTMIELPWNANFGIAFHGLKKFTFAVDLFVAFWESYDTLKVDFACSRTGDCYEGLNAEAVYPKKWKTSYQLSIGVEYRPIESVALRVGYGYVTDPTDPEYYDAMLPDGDRNLICMGIGYRAPRFFKMDLGYMLAMWDGKKNNEIGKPSSTGPNGYSNGTYKTMAHLLGITIGLSFGGPRKGKPETMRMK